jgi:two-component system, cell cycle sensor histidine kinase and response regulator CckA
MATILVVDDEKFSLALIEEMLASAGHEVLTAQDGEAALDILAKANGIRAIITDLRMPRFNGLRLIRDLRGAGDTIPIIAVSGVNADQLILAEDYGANAILTKPLDRDKLLKALDDALEQTRSKWSEAWIHPEFGSVGDR